MFYVETTDTYGDEANYTWVRYYMVKAKTFLGAIRKVGREEGLSFRIDGDFGEQRRYRAKNACICAIVNQPEEEVTAGMKGNAKEL